MDEYWIPSLADFDKSILDKLATITVTDENGNQQPITASYYMPEHEGDEDVDEKRPAIVFFIYDMTPDIRKKQSILYQKISVSPTDITLKQIPSPMKIFYQFNIVTEYKQHENEIIMKFMSLFPELGYLTVVSPTNEELNYDFFMKGFMNGDTNQSVPNGGTVTERLFRKSYRYHLMTELDVSSPETYKQVTAVNPSVTNTSL